MARPSRLLRVATRPDKPLVLFDGDCSFCRLWIDRWKSITGNRVDYAPWQEAAGRFPEIPREAFDRAMQLVLPSGEIFEGAQAVFRALAVAPGHGTPLWMYQHVPGFAAVAELSYKFVASHRGAGYRVTSLLWGRRMEKPTYFLSSALFLRLLGICYLIAFVSLWLQVPGLIGSRGILPVQGFLDWARSQTGPERYWLLPTLCWLDSSDSFLHFLCGGGVLLSLLLTAGIAPLLCLPLLWLFYLSLSIASQVFLEFQWDTLLLETGFLALFLAPWKLRARLFGATVPSPAVLFLLRWLLFRLTFTSGAVKLASGDPTWRSLTALQYHYETQPLPPWTAWFMHQLPPSLQTASLLFCFFAELAAPFLIFAPRRLRLFGLGVMVALQVLIAATGNYAFFNLLTLALCILLLDDVAFPKRRPLGASLAPARSNPAVSQRAWPTWVIAPLTAVILLVTSVQMASRLNRSIRWPGPIAQLVSWVTPLRSANSYGLFAVMTTSRPEIIVEASDDEKNWLAYEFRWKPGDLRHRPRFVAPHQPRLDWQMWFAALGRYEENVWFINFLARLLQGSPDVLSLLKTNPFPDRPPQYVRALLYDYHFTNLEARRQTGAWWRREPKGLYCPVLSQEMLARAPQGPRADREPPS